MAQIAVSDSPLAVTLFTDLLKKYEPNIKPIHSELLKLYRQAETVNPEIQAMIAPLIPDEMLDDSRHRVVSSQLTIN